MGDRRWTSEEFEDLQRRQALKCRPASAPARPVSGDNHSGKSDGAVAGRTERKRRSRGAGGSDAPHHISEDQLQRQVAQFLDKALPAGTRWLHIPNGGARDGVSGAILKAQGVKAGAADVLVFRAGLPPVWIELKTTKGQLRVEQKDWRDWCATAGIPWALCRSLDDVIAALTDAGVKLRGRA